MEITTKEAQEQHKTAETAAKDVERAFSANQWLRLYRSAMYLARYAKAQAKREYDATFGEDGEEQ